MKKTVVMAGVLALTLAVATLSGCGGKQETTGDSQLTEETTEGTSEETTEEATDEAAGETTGETTEEKEAVSDYPGTPCADIVIKDFGTVKVELDPSQAPESVKNFIELADDGFYDGLTFHRIIDGFMMQGGDPSGDDTGGSEKNVKGEFSANGVDNNISHTRGTISMARAQDPDSGSSQFFIVQSDSTFLDGQYAGFGRVKEGMDIVDKICKEAKPTDGNGSISPDEQPVMEKVTIYYE